MVRKFYTKRKLIARITKANTLSISKKTREGVKKLSRKELRDIASDLRSYRRRYKPR